MHLSRSRQWIRRIHLQLRISDDNEDSHAALQIHLEHAFKQFKSHLSCWEQHGNGPPVQRVVQIVIQVKTRGHCLRRCHLLLGKLGLSRSALNILEPHCRVPIVQQTLGYTLPEHGSVVRKLGLQSTLHPFTKDAKPPCPITRIINAGVMSRILFAKEHLQPSKVIVGPPAQFTQDAMITARPVTRDTVKVPLQVPIMPCTITVA